MPPKHMKIEVNNAVFSLPYHVARKEGYFAAEGYDVELVPAGSGRDRDKEVPERPIEDHRTVRSYGWHEGIEKGEFCMYRACEWGQIRRTQDSSAKVKVDQQARRHRHAGHRRASRIGLQRAAGPAWQDRGGQLPRRLTLHHAIHARRLDEQQGGSEARARRRTQAAVAFPRRRQGRGRRADGAVDHGRRKKGHKIICEAFYEGAEVGVPSLDPEGYASVDRAIRRAVDSINAGIEAYFKYMISEVPKRDRRAQRARLLSRQIPLRLSAAVHSRGIRAHLRVDGWLGPAVAGEPFRGHRRSQSYQRLRLVTRSGPHCS